MVLFIKYNNSVVQITDMTEYMTLYKHLIFYLLYKGCKILYQQLYLDTDLFTLLPTVFLLCLLLSYACITAQINLVPQAWLLLWDPHGHAWLINVQWASAEHSLQTSF